MVDMIYYFDVLEDGGFFKDEFGNELASNEDALTEAQALILEMLNSYDFAAEQKTIRVEVRRGGGNPLYAATLELTGRWTHGLAEAEADGCIGAPFQEP